MASSGIMARKTRRLPRVKAGSIWPKGSIVYICGASRVAFGPHDTALGGSEQAVVNLSKAWTKAGRPVVVYGNVKECKADGVEYRSIHKLNLADKFDTVIFWRSFGVRLIPVIQANKRIVDLHDSWDPKSYVSPSELLEKVDLFMVKSMYHRSLYPYIPDSKIKVLMNGIDMSICEPSAERYAETIREPHRLIYASTYERGLEPMLKYSWPKIIAAVPDAELHIFYGMNRLEGTPLGKRLHALFKQKGIKEHGRVSLERIAEEKCKSAIHFYVSNSETEIDCISVRESLICGAVPVLGKDYVFKERDGIHIPGSTDSPATYRRAGSTVAKLLLNQELLAKKRVALKKSPTIVSWEEIAKKWLAYF
jgi:glycosyltransferase involved in cell wall biosynthesis